MPDLLCTKKECQFCELWLGTEKNLSLSISEKIRGYIGSRFIEDSLFHNHKENGKYIFRYPLIQYKIINDTPLLIGIEEGIDSLWKVFEDIVKLNFDNIEYEIFDKTSLLKKVSFGISDSNIFYSFLTPWLALNEENYEKYRGIRGWQGRKGLLEKILVGNIISMSKGLGYTVPEPIKAKMGHIKEVPTSLKGVPMLGFLGDFSVNFQIPDYFGLGKSVSRGFGAVKRK